MVHLQLIQIEFSCGFFEQCRIVNLRNSHLFDMFVDKWISYRYNPFILTQGVFGVDWG
jgi:hypothetical protein